MSEVDYDDIDDRSLSDLEIDIEDAIGDIGESLLRPVQVKKDYKLTTFEVTSVLIHRSRQLDNGKPPNIEVTWEQTSTDIAMSEFDRRKIRLCVVRHYPNGTSESFEVDKMDR